MAKTKPIKVGDSVVVRAGVKNPDFDSDIGGWQGRVSEIDPESDIILVDLDSITLKSMPDAYITQCEEEGFGWNQIYLGLEDVKLTTERDNEEDVDQALDALDSQHAYDHLGEDIRQILAGVDLSDEMEVLDAWADYLQDNLTFPFDAIIEEHQEGGALKAGQSVRVKDILEVEDLYGVMVTMTHKRSTYQFPLCDLEAKDKQSDNYKVLKNYVVWFANR